VRFGAVHRGECWLSVATADDAAHLRVGDCFVLAGSADYAVASAPGLGSAAPTTPR
jgi:hypothetical protein